MDWNRARDARRRSQGSIEERWRKLTRQELDAIRSRREELPPQEPRIPMRPCEVCGNLDSRPLVITRDGREHVFDSLECAIHVLAPTCAQCGGKIIAHRTEARSSLACCADCARRVRESAGATLTPRPDAESAPSDDTGTNAPQDH